MKKTLLTLASLALLMACSKSEPTTSQGTGGTTTGTSIINTANTSVAADTEGWPSQYTGVMLQAFAWEKYVDSQWTTLESQASELAPYFSLVWVPQSGKPKHFPSMGYDVLYYFNQNSAFGTEAQLRSMISTFKRYGIGTIADVVINHRETINSWTDFPSETYKGVTYTMTPQDIVNNDEAAENGYSTGTNADTGDNWSGMRDLDHKSQNVQNIVKVYLDYLKNDLGYLGFRYDLVKGYDPVYTAQYNRGAKVQFSVGEYWDNYDNIKAWLDRTAVNGKYQSAAFDFPNKYQLNKACNDNQWNELMWKRNGSLDQPAGLIHMNTLQRYAITFVDNHDTGRTDAGHDGSLLRNNITAANAFILSMPGTPCVFLPHWLKYKSEIKALIKARQAAGIHNESAVEVLSTGTDVFAAKASGLYGTLIVKVGPSLAYNAPSGYTMVASGTNYAVWLDSTANARYK